MRILQSSLLALSFAVSVSAQQATVIKASHMIDPRREAPINDAVVVVRGDVIEAAGGAAEVKAPPGARTIDLMGYTILPGLMDCHTHITGNPGDGGDTQMLREGVAYDAIYGVVNAKATLEAGFTTIRNVGAPGYSDVALRNLIARGVVPGPRMWVATWSLGATGGHGDINGWNPELKLPGTAQIVDGVDDLRKAVRTQVKFGADLIKVVATGGVLSSGDSFNDQQYSFEELKAIVDTARMLGRKVAAHAHSPAGMKDAIRAGVASIEHGSLIDDEGIRLAKEHGTFVVPTLYTLDFIVQEGASYGVPDYSIEKAKSMAKMQRERLGAAFHAGVKFAYGTDAGVFPHGRNAKDFRILVEQLDVRPIEAIRMATVNAADLIGIADRVGTLEPGKWADLIAVAGNPLENIALLEDVRFVMKGGVVYKSPAGK